MTSPGEAIGVAPGAGAIDRPQVVAAPRTGHPAVDDLLAELDAAATLSPADQVAAFDAGYRRLEATLGTIDDG